MLRFSIREILLLTVVVGLGFGWWVHSRQLQLELSTFQDRYAALEQRHQIDVMARSILEAKVDQLQAKLKGDHSPVRIIPLHAVYLNPDEA